MPSLLEDYLNEVAKSLRPLPVARRDEELREMRQHLLNAVAVNRKMGQSEGEAAKSAVAQFGAPEEVSENIVSAWQRGEQIENRRSFWGVAVCITAFMLLTDVALVPRLNAMVQAGVSPTHPFVDVSTAVTGCLALGLVMAISGWVSGYFFPKCAVPGVKIAMLVLYGISFCVKLFQGLHSGHGDSIEGVVTSLFSGVIYGAVAVLSARAGSEWRRDVEDVYGKLSEQKII